MTRLDKLKNDILIGMRLYLDANTMNILEAVIIQAVQGIDVVELDTLPATVDNTNQYILNLFMVRKAPKLSEKTVGFYLSTVRELITLIDKPLTQMTESDIEYYLMMKQQNNNSNVALNNHRRNLSAFYTWMRKAKLIIENPCEGIEPYKQVVKPVDHLEAVDSEVLKGGCRHKRDRALIEFMRCTALRRGEIPQIKVSDVDFHMGKILVYGHKTSRYRTVYLDAVALKYLRDYLNERGVSASSKEPLFTHLHGDTSIGLDAVGIYASIKAIAGRSGLGRDVYPHLFRKSCATQIVKRGGSNDQAGAYLGHAPKGVTAQHYISTDETQVYDTFRHYVAM